MKTFKVELWMTKNGLEVVKTKGDVKLLKYKNILFGVQQFGKLGEVVVAISTLKGVIEFNSTVDKCISTTCKLIDCFE